MKRKIAVLLACMLCMSAVPTYAESICVMVNDEKVEFSNAQPIIVDSHTLVPLRGVFERLGYTIYWKADTKTAVIASEKRGTLRVTAGSSVIYKGEEELYAEVPARIINGSMYLPLRAVGEAVGLKVSWDSATKTVYIGETSTDITEEETAEENIVDGLVSCDILYAFAEGCKDGSFDKAKVEMYLEDNNMRANKDYAQRLVTIIQNGCDETELNEYMTELGEMTNQYSVKINKTTKNVSDAFLNEVGEVLNEFTNESLDTSNMISELEWFGDNADKVLEKLKKISPNSKDERESMEILTEYVSTMQAYAKTGIDVKY